MRRAAVAITTLISLSFGAREASAQQKFAMEVSPHVASMQDTITVTVRIELDGVSGPDRYWHPGFRHFTVTETAEPEISTFSVSDAKRGRTLRTSVIRTYVLKPSRPGTLMIQPARMRVGRTEYRTDFESVTVHAGAESAAAGTIKALPPGRDPTAAGGVGAPGFSPPQPTEATEMFLHAVADKRELFVGEQVTVTWLLYTRSEILRFEPVPPRLDGFWAEVLYEPTRLTYFDTKVGTSPYQVVIVAKRALFPTKAGAAVVEAMSASVASHTTALGRKKRITSNRIELTVKELPAGQPPRFDATYVGTIGATAKVDRSEIDAAESLTLTLTIGGTVAIRRTNPPQLNVPGFQFRQPRDFEESVDTSHDAVRGERIYRYWTTPQKGGPQEIPSIEIPYFDPRTGAYAIARTQAIPIVVRGDPEAQQDPAGGATKDNIIGRDIRLIREGDNLASRLTPQLHRRLWFWALAGLPPVLFVLVILVDKIREGLKKETPRARLRRARGRARQRFRVAEIHLRGNRPAKFFGELSRMLIEHIEERVGQSVQSMTRDELLAFLKSRGFAESTIRQLDRDLQAFDVARFSPTPVSSDEMRDALRRTKNVLRGIERARLQLGDSEAEGEAA